MAPAQNDDRPRGGLWQRIFPAVYDRIMDATERAGMAERRTTLLAQARGRTLELGADSRRRASKQPPF